MKGFMKAVRHRTLLVFCLIILLLADRVRSYAAFGGVTIHLIDSGNAGTAIADVEFLIYQVGTIGNGISSPAFYPVYEIHNYPQTAEEIEAAISILQQRITGEPLQAGTTDEYGKLEISGLDQGIYFITAGLDNPYGEIMPFIIGFPYYEMIDGRWIGPVYEVEVEPKSRPYQEPPDSQEPPDQSSDSEDSRNQGEESDTVDESANKDEGSGAKTKDASLIGLYLCILTSSIFIILGLTIKMKGEKKKYES